MMDRNLGRVLGFSMALSVMVLLLDIYRMCNASLALRGLTARWADGFAERLFTPPSVFSGICSTRLLSLGFMVPPALSLSSFPFRKRRFKTGAAMILVGLLPYFLSLRCTSPGAYVLLLLSGFATIAWGCTVVARSFGKNLKRDVMNSENESFEQEERKIENEWSVNLPTLYRWEGKERKGWINVVNPFRATMVLGTPGSGKTFSVINAFISQMIRKGYAMYIYDYKYDDLSVVAYNCFLRNRGSYPPGTRFCLIDFDDPLRSHRCNPLSPRLMTDISDAYESAYTIMLNLNRSWIQKQGDFFVESPIVLLAAAIWFLKIYADGRYCTFPHAIELLGQPYEDLFTIFTDYKELRNYISPFVDAWKGGAQEQLQGQIASAKIPLSRLASPQLYWVMSGDDFDLDINDSKNPKILCIGNNPDRQNIYSAALGLYNTRIVRLMNRKGQRHSAVVIDELPTIYFRGLDNLIATARSNRVAVCLGFQDFSQLRRDYGEKESHVIENTVGNVFSGQVTGDTARMLSQRFGKILQTRESVSESDSGTSESTSTQMDTMIPTARISNLSQGVFVGAVADNFSERIPQKVFHSRITVDPDSDVRKWEDYSPIPLRDDLDEDFVRNTQYHLERNAEMIRRDIKLLVRAELNRINANSGTSSEDPGTEKKDKKPSATAKTREENRDGTAGLEQELSAFDSEAADPLLPYREKNDVKPKTKTR